MLLPCHCYSSLVETFLKKKRFEAKRLRTEALLGKTIKGVCEVGLQFGIRFIPYKEGCWS